MKTGRLSKERGGERVRTDEVIGKCHLPEEGKRFQMMNASPVEDTIQFGPVELPATNRLIDTSPVVDVEHVADGKWTFETMSGSIYCLEILEEA